jgi:hypothetical protein
MKKISKIFIGTTLAAILAFSFFGLITVYATGPLPDYTVLVPLPGTTENCSNGSVATIQYTTNSDGSISQTGGCQTNFQTYLPGIFNLAIGIAAVLAFVVITYGGILYMTSDSINDTKKGKEYIENAFWGLGLTLGAWVILYTINPQLVQFNLNMTTPQSSAFVQSAADIAAITAASQTASGLTASGADLLSGDSLATDNGVRSILAVDDIGVNHTACTTTQTTNCTDVNLLNPVLIMDLAGVAAGTCGGSASASCTSSCATPPAGSGYGSSCAVTITGGNEGTLHNTDTTHSTGDTVDLAPTAALNNYLGNTSPTNGTQVSKNGMTFTYETAGANAANTGPHWHATICTGTSVSTCP